MDVWQVTIWAQAGGGLGVPATQPHGEAEVLKWGAILIGVVVVGAVFIMLLRRRLAAGTTASVQDAGFSLADLRSMRDRGEITPEEYEQTRANVIAKVKKKSEEPPKPKAKPGDSKMDLAE